MGIDYDSGMVVGLQGSEIDLPEGEDCKHQWAYEVVDFTVLSPYYDCDPDGCFMGVGLSNNFDLTEEAIEEFSVELKEARDKFFTITGKQGKLIASQDIT